jgi:hypothetical protein
VPHVRVRLGADNITITGNVNLVDNVRVNNTEAQSIPVYIVGNVIAVNQNSSPWVISANSSVNSNVNPIYVNFTNANISLAAGSATIGNVGLNAGNNIIGNVRLEGNLAGITGNIAGVTGNIAGITGNLAGITGNIAGITGNLAGITGNIAGITGNVNVTQGTSPWITSATISGGNITVAQTDVAVTAFDEPIAVPLTPVIQADAQYGLDPDFWVKTELNNGNVVVSDYNTWQVNSGTSAGGYARLATSKYMSYQSGQGSIFRWTAAFTATGSTKDALGVDNIVQNTGPIDREDGYSFGFSGSTDTSNNNRSKKIGILHRRNGKVETQSLTITTPPTGNQTATITLNGTAYSVAITAGDIYHTANEIATALKAITAAANYWDIEGCNGIVTFSAYSPGAKSGTYSFSSTGAGTIAVATFAQTAAGTTPSDTWTYVDQWDNQSIAFDPTKLNVYQIDLRWLGAGRVRFFMEDPSTGKMVLVHTQKTASTQLYPHINKPALRIAYRSGTTNPAITPSQNVVVTGSSVFCGVQGVRTQTGSSQGVFNLGSTTKAKDLVHHLISLQNPFVRSGGVNKASLSIQMLTVSVQGADPCVVYVVKDAFGTSDVLSYIAIPNTTPAMFAQYSTSIVTIDLATQRIANVQTLGINGNAEFDLAGYNLTLSPGETVSVFISSTNAINKSAVGLTWLVD